MNTEEFKRKLSAILSADVEGYSRLMGEDEDATIRTLTAYRELMTTLIQEHRGRVVDSPGDNLLADFTSVVDAVRCAVEIQEELRVRNAELPENRRMKFRIGINLGDVVQEGERIYGDGVNIAARLETLSEAGGICVSRPVHDQVRRKLPLQYDYIGAQSVKNISEPVYAYKVRIESQAETFAKLSAEMPIYAEPRERASIAVLPFENLSNDPEQESFADGMTDDIITDLSKIPGLLVTSHNSVFSYKGKSVKVQHIGRDLGVRYILEGSVRKIGNQIRINAQFIDTNTDNHLWADRYDGHLDDMYSLQDQITQKIVSALVAELTPVEQQPSIPKKIDNTAAIEAMMQGEEYLLKFTPDNFNNAIKCFNTSIELDPENGRAYAALAFTYLEGANQGWLPSLNVSYFEARLRPHYYLKLAMQSPTSLAYLVLSKLKLYRRQYEEAVDDCKHAMTFDPNNPICHSYMGVVYTLSGRPMEAMDFHRRAMRLDAENAALYLYQWGFAYFCMGQLEDAITLIERARRQNPEFRVYTAILASAYAQLGNKEEAVKAINSYHKTWLVLPTLRRAMYFWPFKDHEIEQRFAEGLLEAGISGQPDGYYKVRQDQKLTGDEIRGLILGKTMTGYYPWNERQEWIDRTGDGKAVIRGGKKGEIVLDQGQSYIDGDILFDQWEKRTTGLKIGGPVYRNPEGTFEQKDEYLMFTDFAFLPMSQSK
jgi:TolB-like protein/Flp pilus assembly protein TadD